MKLLLKLTLRDLKNARGFAALFIFNLSLGLLGFIVLHSFKNNINTTLQNRSKVLLASDITVTGRRNLTEKERSDVDEILENKSRILQYKRNIKKCNGHAGNLSNYFC